MKTLFAFLIDLCSAPGPLKGLPAGLFTISSGRGAIDLKSIRKVYACTDYTRTCVLKMVILPSTVNKAAQFDSRMVEGLFSDTIVIVNVR